MDSQSFTVNFVENLYQIHMDEISFLLEHSIALHFDEEIQWPDIQDFEKRLSAHVEAVKIGKKDGIDCAKAMLQSPHEEDIQAAVYTLVSIGDPACMDEVFGCLENADEALSQCYVNALGRLPFDLDPAFFTQLLSDERISHRIVAIKIMEYKNQISMKAIEPLLLEEDPKIMAALASALRVEPDPKTGTYLEKCFDCDDLEVQKQALLGQLFRGHQPAIGYLCDKLKPDLSVEDWMVLFLALGGQAEHAELLCNIYQPKEPKPAVLTAMGVLGNVQVVDTLLSALSTDQEEIKIAAAWALDLLTGANLREIIKSQEEIDDDTGQDESEEIDDDTEQDESDEIQEPIEPSFIEEERVCTSKDEWSKWWNRQKNKFRANVRWRYGQPYTFDQSIQEMENPSENWINRQRAHDELVVRSGMLMAFRSDWSVNRQKESIRRWKNWWQANKTRFTQGRWYFHGG